MTEKIVLGLTEEVTVNGPEGKKTIIARIDSGAVKSSIDLQLASEMRLGPIVASKLVKSANGKKLRPIIEVELELCGSRSKEHFTMADRSHMKYQMLIGQNILKHGFLIDPCKYEGDCE